MATTTTICSHCRMPLDDDHQPSQPCPDCGGVGRTIAVQVESIETIVEVPPVGIEVRHGAPAWNQRWQQFNRWLDKLRDGYAPDNTLSNTDLEAAADACLLASHSMFDWLKEDASVPQTAKLALLPYVRSSQPIKICRAYADPSKHMFLKDLTRLTARIKNYRSSGGKASIAIEYGSPQQPAQAIDALELAEQCQAAWQKFLDMHGLKPT